VAGYGNFWKKDMSPGTWQVPGTLTTNKKEKKKRADGKRERPALVLPDALGLSLHRS
jgi:hypothetical protein